MKLGKYKGVQADKITVTVTGKDIQQVLERKQRENSVMINSETDEKTSSRIEYQQLDDDFAKDFSEYDTLAQWEEAIREDLQIRKETAAYNRLSRNIMTKIINSSKINVDKNLAADLAEDLYEEFLDNLKANHISMETFKKRSGKDENFVKATKLKEARRYIQEQIVLSEVAKKEHLHVTKEEFTEEIALIAQEEGEDPADFIDYLDDQEIEEIREEILLRKAMQLIMETAVII